MADTTKMKTQASEREMQHPRRPPWNVMSPFSLVTDTLGTSHVALTKRTDDYHSKWPQAWRVRPTTLKKTIYTFRNCPPHCSSDSVQQKPQ